MTLFDPDPFTSGPSHGPHLSDLSNDTRRTLQNRRTIALGVHPVSGLPLLDAEWGYRCGHCAHHFANRRNRTYWKCDLNATRGPGTDIRLRWPACTALRITETP